VNKSCRAAFNLYGGHHKKQRQNYTLVPRGTEGVVTSERVDEDGSAFVTAKFMIEGRLVYVRCALAAVQLASSL
jgi:hypothetical protein